MGLSSGRSGFAPRERLGGVANDGALGFEVELYGFHPPAGFGAIWEEILGQVREDAGHHLFLGESGGLAGKDAQERQFYGVVFSGIEARGLAGNVDVFHDDFVIGFGGVDYLLR